MNGPSSTRNPEESQRVGIALQERSYDVVIGQDLFSNNALLRDLGSSDAVIVTNEIVGPLYGERVSQLLRQTFKRVSTVTLPDGESHKNWATLEHIFDALLAEHFDRKATLVALGGGVVGDLAGFAAACYMRGVDYIQIPTTLLAQVDSSVGGKTAINHPAGKNMIGAFHQPRLVIADVDCLNTLPRRELVAGLAEVIKYGAALDAEFLAWIESNVARLLSLETAALIHAVRRSCEIKAEVVAADERESGRRALLNFGHTFGHAIEAGLGYGRWLHGEAVGCGMVLAAKLSQRLGLIEASRAQRLERVVEMAGLPTVLPDIDVSRLIDLMRVDKKAVSGEQRFVLLEGVSNAIVTTAPAGAVEQVLLESRAAGLESRSV